jgi:hypothetical protein
LRQDPVIIVTVLYALEIRLLFVLWQFWFFHSLHLLRMKGVAFGHPFLVSFCKFVMKNGFRFRKLIFSTFRICLHCAQARLLASVMSKKVAIWLSYKGKSVLQSGLNIKRKTFFPASHQVGQQVHDPDGGKQGSFRSNV